MVFELRVGKVLVSELQQEPEGQLVAVLHDRGDTLCGDLGCPWRVLVAGLRFHSRTLS